MLQLSNYMYFIILIIVIILLYVYMVQSKPTQIKENIKEGFINNNQGFNKSKFDTQFAPLQLLGSKNLINDQNLLTRKLLQWEYPFNGHNAGYTNLGWPPLAPLYSYPTLNFHSNHGPQPLVNKYSCSYK